MKLPIANLIAYSDSTRHFASIGEIRIEIGCCVQKLWRFQWSAACRSLRDGFGFREEIFNGGSNPVFLDFRKRRIRIQYVFDYVDSESEERIQIRPSVQKLEVHWREFCSWLNPCPCRELCPYASVCIGSIDALRSNICNQWHPKVEHIRQRKKYTC